jgi:hypothetical protein
LGESFLHKLTVTEEMAEFIVAEAPHTEERDVGIAILVFTII